MVTPIGTVKGRQHNFTVGDGDVGPVASRLKSALLDIQQGRAPDTHGWMERIG
ncbi:Branched-chain-amino-acid aminotransferase [compost metagenome]